MAIEVTGVGPLSHADAMALQAAELARTLELLRAFDASDWARPTDCPAWTVREMYLHVLGACEATAMRENAHQMLAARRHRRAHGGPLEAALSAVQVRERADLAPDALVARLVAVADATVRRRRRMPALVRRASLAVDGPVVERWTLGYLVDTIYLRDLWMHRVDACRATGRPFTCTTEHDGRIVADVVAEWARRHGQPVTLELTGEAGGSFVARGVADPDGSTAPLPALDAVEFCRVLAGRETGTGLLATIVPF